LKPLKYCAAVSIALLVALLTPRPASADPSGPALPADASAASKIQHVLVILQENHTFDNYFGTFPGTDNLSAGQPVPSDPRNPNSPKISPFHLTEARTPDLNHAGVSAHAAYNGGKMDGFIAAQTDRKLPGRFALGYYDGTDLPYYWNLARNYVLADRFFSSALGGSLINHQYWVSAQSSGTGEAIPANGVNLPTIFDRLEGANASWKFYVKNYDPSLTFRQIKGNSPKDSQLAWIPPLTMPSFVDNPQRMAKIVDLGHLYSDLAHGDLPAVSYLVQGGTSEHPPGHVVNGQNATVAIIDAIMRSELWRNTAIVLSWDDWGGWYDHVPPPQVDRDGYGFRVPALIISPYAKKGYILHETADFTSILKFIERLHGLSPMTARDANAYDLMGAFDFQQRPRRPEPPPVPGFKPLQAHGPTPDRLIEMYGAVGGLSLAFIAVALTGRRRWPRSWPAGWSRRRRRV
jgi:phospholipase C